MSLDLQILLIAIVTAVAAALPGTFLVLRRMAMVSDAISHSILPGIVVAFFVVHDLSSPLLLLAAAASGVFTVAVIELVRKSGLVAEDAAIGLVFPALFSLGVILISRYASGAHLDTDAVLLGKLEFAPFARWIVAGHDLGPSAFWSMSAILVLNLVVICVAFKELKLATVDPGLAALLGYSPAFLHYGLMTLVSITAVGAFNAVGSILVVALMIAPAAAAYLVNDRLGSMLGLASVFAVVAAVGGWAMAYAVDASIAGSMAVACGIVLAAAFFFAPHRGLISQLRRRASQRLNLAVRMMTVHLVHHEDTPEAAEECRADRLHRHLLWNPSFIRQVIRFASSRDLVNEDAGLLRLTDSGRALANASLEYASPEKLVEEATASPAGLRLQPPHVR
ncbi:MAG: metal ABC transporter permease [bacterium]|nr:metal ABC transporter permease [bacterium]